MRNIFKALLLTTMITLPVVAIASEGDKQKNEESEKIKISSIEENDKIIEIGSKIIEKKMMWRLLSHLRKINLRYHLDFQKMS